MADLDLETLFARFLTGGDLDALGVVFDRVAPELERLARKLTRDRAQAEDLVQATFLTALERPGTFEAGRALRPWLMGILVHRASDERRRAARVPQVDRLEQREVEQPLGALNATEFQDAVARAIDDLPEGLREVLRGRLLDDRDSGELAEELAISRGTLRVRLHRGLERLRAALPAGLATGFALVFIHSRGLAQVRSQVMQEGARVAGKGKLALPAGVLGTGMVLMSKKVVVVAGVAALGILGVALQRGLLSTPATPKALEQESVELVAAPRVAEQATTEPAQREEVQVADRAPTSAPAQAEAAVLAGWPLSGRVVDQGGRAVPGAEVLGWNSTRNEGSADLSVLADGNGEFRFEHLGPKFVVTARADGLACKTGLRGTLSEHANARDLTVVMSTERRMHGVILDPERRPVADAEVWVPNGLNSRSSRDQTHVPEVTTFRAGRASTTTDSAGEFELDGLSQPQNSLCAESAPYLIFREWLDTGQARLEVVLDAGRSVAGRVLDAGGKPAVGARVRYWPFWSNVQTVDREVLCDERGNFTLTGMNPDPETPSAIAVHHEGHALEVVQPIELGDKYIEVRLQTERVLAGRVVDGEGKPVPDVEVWIEGDREMNAGAIFSRRSTWEFCNHLNEATTDEAGEFRFDKLYPGGFTVHAISPEDLFQSVEIVTRTGDQGIELVLDSAAMRKVVLLGNVRDARTGEPITKFKVTPMIGSSGSIRSFESSDGDFELPGLPAGPIHVTFKADGYAARSVALRSYEYGDHHFEIALSPARILELLVLDEERVPWDAGLVEIYDLEGQRLSWSSGPSSTTTSTPLREGEATLSGLPAERLTLVLRVGPRDEPGVHRVELDLTNPIEGPFEVVIPRSPESLRDAGLMLYLIEGSAPTGGVTSGEWLKQEWKAGRLVFPKSEVDITVSRNGQELGSAHVTPLPGGKFFVQEQSGTSAWGGSAWSSSSEGERPVSIVMFDHLPRGKVTVTVRGAGYHDIDREFESATGKSPTEPTILFLRSQ